MEKDPFAHTKVDAFQYSLLLADNPRGGGMELHQALETVLMWMSHETLHALADGYILRNRQKQLMLISDISKQARARNTKMEYMHFDLYICGKHYTSQMVRNSIPHRLLHVIPNQENNKIPLNPWRLQNSGKTYPLRMGWNQTGS
jgi:hypothetical protein